MNSVLQRKVREHLTEQPVPLVMDDTQILNFLSEYGPIPRIDGKCHLEFDEVGKVSGYTLRETVCLAAAKLEGANS